MRQVYFARLLRSTSFSFSPLSLAAGAYIGTQSLWERVAVWDNAVSAVVAASLVVGSIQAFAAAWDGGRDRRTGVSVYRVLSPRRRFAASMLDLCVAWTGAALVFVVLSAWFLLRTVGATWGSPNWLWLLSAGLGLLAQVGIGSLAGALFSARIIAPIVGLGSFFGNQALIQFLPAVGAVNAGWLAFGREQQQNLFAIINYPLLTLQAAWYLGVCLSVVALLALCERGSTVSTVALGTAAALAILVGLVGTQASTSNFFLPQPRAFSYVCDEAGIVCLHPAFSDGLPEITDRAMAMRQRVRGTPFAIESFQQRPRGTGGIPEFGLAIHVDNLDHGWVSRDLGEAAQELTDPLLGSYGPCGDFESVTDTGNIVGLGSIVVRWISDAEEFLVFTSPDDERAAERFDRLSEDDKREWIASHFVQICTGSLTPSDFGL